MAGLTSTLSFSDLSNKKRKDILKRIKTIFEIPSLKYSVEEMELDSFVTCSIIPSFIKEKKIKFIDNHIIALDGDFYNENELMSFLKKTNLSKLEIIYYLFKENGNDFVKKINGEFNIFIYDDKKKALLVFNDRYARKPLFYYLLNEGIILSSEKKGIICLIEEKHYIDEQGFLELFVFRHNLCDRTFIKNIFHLKPASILTISPHGFSISQYFEWDFSFKPGYFSREIRLKEIANTITNALTLRIKGKEKIILWLTGGYDSRTIANFIEPHYRNNILTETFGEDNSDEIEIAKSIALKLGYRWRRQKVNISYLDVAKIGTWRSEFAVPSLDHPFMGNHMTMKNDANYIIQGVPGMNEINAGHLRFGKIFAAIGLNSYENFFNRYAIKKESISFFFNKNYFNEYFEAVKNTFIEFFNKIDASNNLYKWDVFNLTQRQPNFSHMADLVESDLFEVLHPFTDINLIDLFTQIPLKDKLFLQITKELLYKYSPELREIPFGDGRGLINKNNKIFKAGFNELKKILIAHGQANIWDKKIAIENDYDNIKITIDNLLLSNNHLKEYLNFDSIYKIINDKSLLIKNKMHLDNLITFTFAYNYFVKRTELNPTESIAEFYSNI